jgi:hypothetical protein
MDFGEARKRVSRIASAPGHPQAKFNLINSITNQVVRREGEKARDSLLQESISLSGRGTRQTGYGPGYKLGAGRWRYEDGKWSKVD